MILHFIRHGLPEQAEGRCLGHTDLPLSAEGADALRRLAAHYADAPSALVSSDLARTRESAVAFGERWAMQPTCTSALREMHFGEWDGRTWTEIDAADGERLATWMGDWAAASAPGGESFPELAARVANWLDALKASPADGTIVAVAHAGSIRAALCHLFAVPLASAFHVRVDYGRISAVKVTEHGAELICLNAATPP